MEKRNAVMTTKVLATLAMLTAILFMGQVVMAFLPNIEIVSLLIILYTQIYKKKVFFIIYTFALLEGIFYGFGIWWVSYLYIWTILAVIVLLVKTDSFIWWSIISGAFGLLFGLLTAIPQFVFQGWAGGVAYYIAGIPYDIAHCVGNAVLCFVLYKPLHMLLSKLAHN